ncbi:MAG TPA: GNAT family N-acetyltransferase [Flavobacteriaceae bacterium]|nr:GNAT family N-acetyltransferase [Flavobacteriaceae bacterium]
MEIIFKQVENEDKQEVLQLFKDSAEKISKLNIDHWQYWKNPPLEKIKWVEEGIANHEFFFIHTLNGEHIGMVRIMEADELYWGKQKDKALYIHSLVVKEKHNGKGLGAVIIQKIANKAKEADCSYVRLDAEAKNTKLCSYYEGLGFEKVGSKELSLSTYNLYQKELK